MSVPVLVFSKDRPMQLHALLESIERYAVGLYSQMTILFRTTFDESEEGYRLCRAAFPFAAWNREGHFEHAVRHWLEHTTAGSELVSFLVDDDLFFRTIGEWQTAPRTVWAFRLPFPPNPDDPDGDYHYPFALDGNVYQRSDVLELLEGCEFDNPTRLEASGACQVSFRWPDIVQQGGEQCLVGIPANRVSDSSGVPYHRKGDSVWAPEALCAAYLAGVRIDLDAIDYSLVSHGHEALELKFRKEQS